jgi:acetolactate synthase regulatory subunit
MKEKRNQKWEAKRYGNVIRVLDDANFQVCEIPTSSACPSDVVNAKLIAAAPEMLDALKYAFEHMHQFNGTTGEHAVKFYELMVAAMKKAEGK